MKNRDYIVGILSFLLLCLSAGFLIYSGYLRDANMDIDMPVWAETGVWLVFALNVFLVAGNVLYLVAKNAAKKECRNFSGILLASFLICFVGNAIFSYSFYSFASEYKIGGDKDYVENEWLEGISLEDVKELLAEAEDDVMIYIGREDSEECRKFEAAFSAILEKYSVITPTYFTDQNGEGESPKEREQFLAFYGIESVPCVFLVSKGKILHKWENPLDGIGEIESYLK